MRTLKENDTSLLCKIRKIYEDNSKLKIYEDNSKLKIYEDNFKLKIYEKLKPNWYLMSSSSQIPDKIYRLNKKQASLTYILIARTLARHFLGNAFLSSYKYELLPLAKTNLKIVTNTISNINLEIYFIKALDKANQIKLEQNNLTGPASDDGISKPRPSRSP